MNLDLAIQNQVIGRSFMADAMHGVASSLGDGHYRLNAFYESEDEAKAILGEPLASYIPNPVSAYVRPPTAPPQLPNPDSFNQEIGEGYSVSYDQSSKTWALNKMESVGGITGWWASITNNGKAKDKLVPLVSKSGPNSMHRFLTTIQEMNLSMDYFHQDQMGFLNNNYPYYHDYKLHIFQMEILADHHIWLLVVDNLH